MTCVCAWCGKFLGEKIGSGTSHGMCESCRDEIMSPIMLAPEMPNCPHGLEAGQWCTACEAENTGLRSLQ